jgi:hypothetical protein
MPWLLFPLRRNPRSPPTQRYVAVLAAGGEVARRSVEPM